MQTSKLYVGNLNYSVDETELREIFGQYGNVLYAKIIEGKGFGFVEMETPEEAETAKAELDGTDHKGRTMKVDHARPQRNNARQGGGYNRSGGGGGYNRGGGDYQSNRPRRQY